MYMVNNMIYGNKLKELREAHTLKQIDLANILEVDRSAYGQYEREYVIIPINHLNTLCNYFNVSLDYIFNLTDKKQYNNSKKDMNLKLSGERLMEFRKNNKLTQTKLGKILECSFGTISGYEIGRYSIATPFLYTISKKFKISADFLLGRIDEPKYLN